LYSIWLIYIPSPGFNCFKTLFPPYCSYFFHLFNHLHEHFYVLFVCHNYVWCVAQVGALQDVRSELSKLRGVLFYKILEDLHAHLYNKGEYRYLFFHSYLLLKKLCDEILEYMLFLFFTFCKSIWSIYFWNAIFSCGSSVLRIFPLTCYSHANSEALLCSFVNFSSIMFVFVSMWKIAISWCLNVHQTFDLTAV
jgi:hypothetical protein